MSETRAMLSPIRESPQDFDNIDYLNVLEPNTNLKKPNSTGCKMGTSLSCVGIIWSFLSFFSMGLTLIGFFMPYWIKGTLQYTNSLNVTTTHFGLWRRCNYPALDSEGIVDIEYACGRYSHFTDIPSVWWQVATVTVGTGCVLCLFIGFLGILACCIDNIMSHALAKSVGVIQFLAGMCITAGCVLYPFGWERNLELQQACGQNISVYNLGTCTIAWAYWLTIAGGGAALIGALLGCHAAKQKTRIRYDRVGL